jgi:hypothetical protein
MCFALLLTKALREEKFTESDWDDAAQVVCSTLVWLYNNVERGIPEDEENESTKKAKSEKKSKRRSD